MKLEIQTPEIPLVFKLKTDIPNGVTVDVPPIGMTRDILSDAIAIAIVTFPINVSAQILAIWLYEKFKDGKSKTVTINKREIEISPDGFIRIIEETIKSEG